MKNRFFNYGVHLHTAEIICVGLCALVVLILKSWQGCIAGDGFGYYNYLPQLFIYGKPYDFTWFKTVYIQYYSDTSFTDPMQHFIVQVNQLPVNKYAPGLAVLWLPFFLSAQVWALVFNCPADGYSMPYQIAMGLASVCALMVCLVFTGKLLQLWSVKALPLRIIGILTMCFGTGLFQQALWYSALSHVYTAAVFTAMVYYLEVFRQQNKTLALGFAIIAFVLLLSIRPLLLLSILVWIPYFIRFKNIVLKSRVVPVLIILGCSAICFWTFYWNINQYGSLWKYTYTQEYFTWLNPQWFHVFFNYSVGLIWNRPWILLGICALFFLKTKPLVYLAVLYGILTYAYSCWWYWPILNRVLIDVACIPVLGCMVMLYKLGLVRPKLVPLAALVLVLLSGWNSLKYYQQQKGIIDAFNCDSDLFWRHALRLKPASVFSVPQQSIKKYSLYTFKDFEFNVKPDLDFELVPKKGFFESQKLQLPEFLLQARFKKIRFSFTAQCRVIPKQLHLWIRLYNAADGFITEIPYYLKSNQLYNYAEFYQFGYSETQADAVLLKASKISFAFWMPEDDGKIKISNSKMEFFSTSELFETVLKP